MYKRLLIISTIALIILIISHVRYYYRITDKIAINQIADFDASKFTPLIESKNPLIITNFTQLNNTIDLDFEILNNNLDKKITFYNSDPFVFPEKQETSTILQFNKKFMAASQTVSLFMKPDLLSQFEIELPDITNQLFGPLDLFVNSSLSISKEFSKTGLMSHSYNRFFLHIIQGSSTVYLFSPKQEPFLYKTSNPNYHNFKSSQVNPWKLEPTKYPDYSKAEYIELTLTAGQILYIPPHWWFYIYEKTDSLSLQYFSHNIYTKISNYF